MQTRSRWAWQRKETKLKTSLYLIECWSVIWNHPTKHIQSKDSPQYFFFGKSFHSQTRCVRARYAIGISVKLWHRSVLAPNSSTEKSKSGNVNNFLENLEMLKIETHYVQRGKCYHILIKLSIYQSENDFKRCL